MSVLLSFLNTLSTTLLLLRLISTLDKTCKSLRDRANSKTDESFNPQNPKSNVNFYNLFNDLNDLVRYKPPSSFKTFLFLENPLKSTFKILNYFSFSIALPHILAPSNVSLLHLKLMCKEFKFSKV